MKNRITIVFILVSFIEIFAINFNSVTFQYIAKPLLVPALILLLWLSKTPVPGKNILLAGLFFSWAGDIFLLLLNSNALFFIFGLACFLITHLFYITFFLKIRSNKISLIKKYPFLLLLVIGYGITLVWLLYPHLADLKIPVIIYATVICTMLLCSLHVYYKVNKPSGIFYLTGAVVFVLSDSLLAFDKFYQPFSFAGELIMITYCAAQYFIVRGFAEQKLDT